jgi:hypothetical protein
MEHPRPLGKGRCFIYGTPQAFWRGRVFHIRNTRAFRRGGVSPAKRPGPGRQTAAGSATSPIPSWPLPQVARSLFPEASGRSGASGFRAVCRVFPGLSRRISCRQKIAPIFRRQKIRGGWIPSGCGEPLREPFSSLKAPYGCRGVRPLSPGSIRPCAAFPWLPTAITLLPPCAPRGFPAGSPQAHAGFSPRILPRRRTRRAHGIRPDETSAFQPPGHPGDPSRSGRGFSRPSPGTFPGKRMGRAWGDGGSGGGDGR